MKAPGQGGVAVSPEQGLLLWQEVSVRGGHGNGSKSLGKQMAFCSVALAGTFPEERLALSPPPSVGRPTGLGFTASHTAHLDRGPRPRADGLVGHGGDGARGPQCSQGPMFTC